MPRATYHQTEAMVAFMEVNKELGRGRLKTADARRKGDELWATLAERLNAMGGCIRDTAAWKHFWNDKKSNIKKALGKRLRASRQTGGGTASVPELSDLDLRIAAIFGEEFACGMPGVAVPAFSQENAEHVGIVNTTSTATAATNAFSPTPSISSAPSPAEDHQPEVATPVMPQPVSPRDGVNEPAIHPSPRQRPARQPRFRRTALSDTNERFAALEQNRVDAEMRLAQAVGEIGGNLTMSMRETRRLVDAQLAVAEAQQETARVQAKTAREEAEAARRLAEAQQETARIQTEAAREQAEAARLLTEAVRNLAEAVLKLQDHMNDVGRS